MWDDYCKENTKSSKKPKKKPTKIDTKKSTKSDVTIPDVEELVKVCKKQGLKTEFYKKFQQYKIRGKKILAYAHNLKHKPGIRGWNNLTQKSLKIDNYVQMNDFITEWKKLI